MTTHRESTASTARPGAPHFQPRLPWAALVFAGLALTCGGTALGLALSRLANDDDVAVAVPVAVAPVVPPAAERPGPDVLPAIINVWNDDDGCRVAAQAWLTLRRTGQIPAAPIVNYPNSSANAAGFASRFGLGNNVMAVNRFDRIQSPPAIGHFTTLVVDRTGVVRFSGSPTASDFAERLRAAWTAVADEEWRAEMPTPPERAATTTAAGSVDLQLGTQPYARATIDGVQHGSTPFFGPRKLTLEPGRHVVELEDPVTGLRRRYALNLKGGSEVNKVVIDLQGTRPPKVEGGVELTELNDVAADHDDDAQATPTADFDERFRLAQGAMLTGDGKTAYALLLQLERERPNDARLSRNLGITASRLRLNDDARRHYQRYLDLAPTAADADKVRQILRGD